MPPQTVAAVTKPRYAVDWDGTIVTDAWPNMGEWQPGAIQSLRTLLTRGEVVVHSCRVAPFETDEATPRNPLIEATKIRLMLDMEGLWDVEVWMRPYKPPARVYIDNRAVRFNGDWPEVMTQVDAIDRGA